MRKSFIFVSLSLSLVLSVGATTQDQSDLDEHQSSQIFPWNAPSEGLHREDMASRVAKQTSPVLDYRFSCDMLGMPKIQDVASSQPILGEVWTGFDLSTHCNYDHNGVTSKNLLQSEKSIATLRQLFWASNATGYSLEIWMTPNLQMDLAVPIPVLALGSHDENNSVSGKECDHTELYVGLRSNVLEIRYLDNDPKQSCRVLLVENRPLKNDELVQIFMTVNKGETMVYLNGEPAMPTTINHEVVTRMTTWDPESKLKLFSDQTDNTNSITLHQVSLYDQLIEAEQVLWGYQQELSGKQNTLLEHEPIRLVAVEEPARVEQGTTSSFEIGGKNRSTSDYVVAIEILSLPPAGTILGDDGTISYVGSRIELPNSLKKTNFMYRANFKDYFTSPGYSYSGKKLHLRPDVFDFRLVALDRLDGRLVGWSDTVTKEIAIQHVNQPATLVLPKVAKLAEAPDFDRDGPIATIDEVNLQDPDLNVDLVRVDIWAYNGTIAIQDHVARADFRFQSNSPEVSWHCHGNPEGSQNMTFVAEPDDVSLILSSIRYEGFIWGQEDTVTIRIFDGVGGPCLSTSDRNYDSVGNDCFKILANVSVPAGTSTPPYGVGIDTRSNIWVALLLVVFSLSCIFLFIQMSFQQLLRMRFWKEPETNEGKNQGILDKKETCEKPEFDVVDFA